MELRGWIRNTWHVRYYWHSNSNVIIIIGSSSSSSSSSSMLAARSVLVEDSLADLGLVHELLVVLRMFVICIVIISLSLWYHYECIICIMLLSLLRWLLVLACSYDCSPPIARAWWTKSKSLYAWLSLLESTHAANARGRVAPTGLPEAYIGNKHTYICMYIYIYIYIWVVPTPVRSNNSNSNSNSNRNMGGNAQGGNLKLHLCFSAAFWHAYLNIHVKLRCSVAPVCFPPHLAAPDYFQVLLRHALGDGQLLLELRVVVDDNLGQSYVYLFVWLMLVYCYVVVIMLCSSLCQPRPLRSLSTLRAQYYEETRSRNCACLIWRRYDVSHAPGKP